MYRFYLQMLLLLFIWPAIEFELTGQSPANLPKVLPPSPLAANFTVYGDYPVSHNTGIPDIQIPLYNFVCGDIEIPIILKYHINSAKPNQYLTEMSNIGYGWILEAGGLVTRTVYGKQDELGGLSTVKYAVEYNQDTESDYWTLWGYSSGNSDSEYDVFSYNFTEGSGKFVLRQKSSGEYQGYPFPFVPWKWNITTSGGANKLISTVKIRDDRANDYTFSTVESNGFANTGWFLTQINSAGNRSVSFSYKKRNLYVPPSFYYTYREDVTDFAIGDAIGGYPSSGCRPELPNQPVMSAQHTTGATSYESRTIERIMAETGTIIFSIDSDSVLINTMTVYDPANIPIKKIVFFRSHFGGGEGPYHRLDSISVMDTQNNIPVQTYKFRYNDNVVMNSRATDFWGWYNGNVLSNDELFLPYTTIDYYFSDNLAGSFWHLREPAEQRTFGALERCVNQNLILAQTLEEIIYPTGGSTQFVFEPNQLSGTSPCPENLGEGLRIKQIINRDNGIDVSKKSYQYQPGTVQMNRFEKMNYTDVSYSITGEYVQSYDCGPYTILTFQRNRTFGENLNPSIQDNYIKYSIVDEYFGTETENIGKNTYYYSYNNNHIYSHHSNLLPTQDFVLLMGTYRNWGNGLLQKVETYKRETGNTFSLLKEKIFEYEFFNDTLFHSLRVFKLSDYPQDIQIGGSHYSSFQVPSAIRSFAQALPTPPVFGVYDNLISTGSFLQKRVTEKLYLPDAVTTITTNNYDFGFKKYLTSSVVSDNTTNIVTHTYKYPYDFTDGVSSFMVDKNDINHVTEQTETRGLSTQKTKTNFRDWGNGIIAPETVETSKMPSNYEPRIVYGGYDSNGNVLSVSKTNDVKTHYIWGYGQTYPVAEIKGATQADIDALIYDLHDLETGYVSTQNAIRNALSGAMVTFYTYKPFVGMTSVTDPNGKKTIYEYDNIGRLKCVKDENGSILKLYDYHYSE